MGMTLFRLIILVSVSIVAAKDPELPLCPTNMQYLPQNLPMHCRMPVPLPTFPPQLFPNPQQAKPGSYPIPLPGLPNPESGLIPIPGPMPMPMPMPMMPMPQAPAQKLPVIVMPFYSPDNSFNKNPSPLPRIPHKKHRNQKKKRKPIHYDSSDEESSSTDTSNESSEHGWWMKSREGRRSNHHHSSKRRKEQNRDLLTPVLQYVTKDGYVIFERKISKGEAKDWLEKKTEQRENNKGDPDSNEEKPINSINFMIREDDTTNFKTDTSPQQTHKNKTSKRKSMKVIKQKQ